MYRDLRCYLTVLALALAQGFMQQAMAQQGDKESHADKKLYEVLSEQQSTRNFRGSVRFIRIKYLGGDWDHGMEGDLNMLKEYGIRTKHRIASKTEFRSIAQLEKFPIRQSPPIVYLTGRKNIELTNAEVKILREFLLTKHGMLFGDNGGSKHFHQQFQAMMKLVLPKVSPVQIPLDDSIHQVPISLSFIPYVAPHGEKHPLSWKVDGRMVCYYHPGGLGAAWANDHAGVVPKVYEASYALGTNIIFYAHAQYSRWLVKEYKKQPANDKLTDELDKLLNDIDNDIE